MKTLEKLSIKHQVKGYLHSELYGPLGDKISACIFLQVSNTVMTRFNQEVWRFMSNQILNAVILPLSDRMHDIFKFQARPRATSKGTVIRPRKIKEKHGKHL